MSSKTTPEHPHQLGLRDWLETLESEGTRYQYSRHVEAVLSAGGGRLTAESFTAYRDAEYERGLSLSSIAVLTAATRKFARYLTERALMSGAELGAFWEIPRLRVDSPPTPVEVNDGFVGRMVAAAERTGDGSKLRVLTDKAVIALLNGCGLRDSEAAAVQWWDYDSGSATSKGGATIYVHRPFGVFLPRTLDVPAKAARVLDELRDLHSGLVTGQVLDLPILAGLWDGGSSAAGLVRPFRSPSEEMVKRVVDRLAQCAGALKGAVTSSHLRALHEERLLRAGVDPKTIAYRLGRTEVGRASS